MKIVNLHYDVMIMRKNFRIIQSNVLPRKAHDNKPKFKVNTTKSKEGVIPQALLPLP